MSSFSVFIPRVFANIGEKRIANVFYQNDIGEVSKVDLVRRTNDKGDSFNMAFVHFEYLFETTSAKQFKEDVENPEVKAKLVYEDPWFWLVLPFEEKEKPVQEKPVQEFYPQQQQQFTPQADQNYFMGYGTMMMTPHGPMWYPLQAPNPLVPPQVAYGNRPSRQRSHPKKRINVPKKEEVLAAQKQEEGTVNYGKWQVPKKKNKVLQKRPTTPEMRPPSKEDGEETD
jgi:hypothetical protein